MQSRHRDIHSDACPELKAIRDGARGRRVLKAYTVNHLRANVLFGRSSTRPD